MNRRISFRPAVALLVVFSVLVVGCTQDKPGISRSSTATSAAAPDAVGTTDSAELTGAAVGEEGFETFEEPAWEPQTIAQELAQREEADGLDAQIAVDSFNLAFGDMPGATDSDLGEAGETSPARALGLAERFQSDLTPEQRQRVEEVRSRFRGGTPVPASAGADLPAEWAAAADGVTVPGSSGPAPAVPGTVAPGTVVPSTVTPTPPSESPAPPVTKLRRIAMSAAADRAQETLVSTAITAAAPDAQTQSLFMGLLGRITQGWKTRLGNVGLPDIRLSISTVGLVTATGLDAYASAVPDGMGCLVTIYPTLYDHLGELGAPYVAFVIAHELFHCVEFEWAPEHWMTTPQWVMEGGADFAGYDYYRKQLVVDGMFRSWFSIREAPLGERTYGGSGLWEVASAEGFDPYSSIKAALRASGKSETVLAAAGLNTPLFLLNWPSRTVRTQAYQHPSWSMQWAGSGEGMRENFQKGRTIELGGTNISGPADFSHVLRAHVFGSGVDVVSVRNKGKHLVSLANDRENLVLGSNEVMRLCVEESRCTCPDGSYGDLRFFNSTDVAVGFSASREAGLITMVAEKFDKKKHCTKPRPKGSSDGDPHMLTMDGVPYELMSAGEFVLVSAPSVEGASATPAFDVQMRTVPAARPGDRYSLVTSVAIRYGTDRVTVSVADYLSKPDEVKVRHNGSEVDVNGAVMGSLTLSRSDERDWSVAAADGTGIDLKFLNGFFVEVTPPERSAAQQVGMLGTGNGDPLDDVKMRDGSPANANSWVEVHGKFADSWRVDDNSSLFDYGPGESTATYTNRDFPGAFESLESDAFQEARRQCHASMGRAATTPEIDACAFDVVATGDDGYLAPYVELVEVRSSRLSTTDVPPLPDRPTTTRSGGASVETGTAALHLKGNLAPIADPDPPADAVLSLVGTVDLTAGAVLTMVMECPAGTDYGVEVSDPAGLTGSMSLCRNNIGVLDVNDEAHSGEAYLWVPETGTYEITLEDFSPEGRARKVDLAVFADDAPAVSDLVGGSWAGTIDGIGDSATVRVPGGTTNAKFTIVASENLCITSIMLSFEDVAHTGIPFCDRADAEIEVVGAVGTDSIVVVHSRDAAGGTFELSQR